MQNIIFARVIHQFPGFLIGVLIPFDVAIDALDKVGKSLQFVLLPCSFPGL